MDEREFWLEVRRGMRLISRAIEARYGLGEDETREQRKLARAVAHQGARELRLDGAAVAGLGPARGH